MRCRKRDGRVRWRFRSFRSRPQSGSHGRARPHDMQISPDKDLNFRCTTAAFTLSRVPKGFVHVVLTRPGTEPSMRFLFVGSHLCAQASFRPPLAGPPLPSASSYHRPGGQCWYSYRGFSPHQFMPMPGVHKRMDSDAAKRCGAIARNCPGRRRLLLSLGRRL